MKNKIIIYFIFFISFTLCQKSWYSGNLKGINDLSLELNIKGVDDDVWEQRIYSYAKLRLLEEDIQVLNSLIPKMVIDINIFDSRIEVASSFLVQLSIYGYSISESEYYKSFSESRITKNMMTSKIFSQSINGQTDSINLYKDIEKNIKSIIAVFIKQWYTDNPIKQF